MVAALRAGAIGYVRKEADPEILLASIRAAARSQSLLDPPVASAVMQELMRSGKHRVELTEREQEVLRQLALGRTNHEIAEALTVSNETVKTHVGNILTKLQLAHRTQAVIYALKKGIISLDEIELPCYICSFYLLRSFSGKKQKGYHCVQATAVPPSRAEESWSNSCGDTHSCSYGASGKGCRRSIACRDDCESSPRTRYAFPRFASSYH